MTSNEYPAIGDRVKIERDQKLYPSKGTWPQFRGRTGTVVQFNLGEIGVCFGKVWAASPKANRVLEWEADQVYWFQPYEVALSGPPKAATVAARSPRIAAEGNGAREPSKARESALA